MLKKGRRITLINMDIIHGIFGENVGAMHEYLKGFVRISSDLIATVNLAIKNQDKKTALETLHRIKGPVGSIGFKKMYSLCEQAEKKVALSDWISAQTLQKEIEDILKKLDLELDKKFKNF